MLEMKPILFNTEMVKAILDGKKTVTRRVIEPQPTGAIAHLSVGSCWPGYFGCEESERVLKPPFMEGDLLYVRETWQFIPCIDCRAHVHGGCIEVPVTYEDRDSVGEGCFVYRADYPEPERVRWHPSIHMPKKAARLVLRVKAVRAERLQDITEAEAKSEGAERAYPYADHETGRTVYVADNNATYRGGFACAWDRTIPKNPNKFKRFPYYWEDNPWVWVIEFEREGRVE